MQLIPPDVEDQQLRPVALDQLLGTCCVQLVVTAKRRREGELHYVNEQTYV
jgi:hypothetical protein